MKKTITFFRLLPVILLALLLMGSGVKAWGQFSIAAGSTNYTQDFNTLTSGKWTDGTTLTGWYAKTTATTSITAYVASTGSSTTAALCAFGIAGTNPLTDRALGFTPSNAYTGASGTGKGYLGWRLKNNTGSTITSIEVTWTGEQWRKENAAGQTLKLFYQTGVTVTDLTNGIWTDCNSTFTSPQINQTAAAIDGNATANRVSSIVATITVNIPAGEEIMLRWEDLNDSGNDHFLALDDVTINATATATSNPEPTNHATSFTATANSSSQITVTWTDATGGQVPAGYLVKASTGILTAPVDGTSEADGTLVKNIAQGTQTAVFTGLSANTTYNFSIWPYSNGGTSIDYKTDGTVLTANAKTDNASTASDYFRSKTTGNWNATGTWESSADGSTGWINATLTPTSSANTITILNGHTVTVTASVSADQVVVNTGGKIIVNSSQTLTIADGTDTYDMSVCGTIENSGTITATGAVKFESGGYYKHTGNVGSMVKASWDANSTCEITGLTSATSLTNFGGQDTAYGNLIWNCTGQTNWFSATGSFDVAGNFTINSTGGGARGINLVTSTANRTFNIAGNLEINGSKLTLTNASGIATLNIGGNLILNSSSINQLDFGYSSSSTAPSSGNYRSIINLKGNFENGNSSVLKITDATYYGKIVFEKNGVQTYSNQNATATMNGIDHIVNAGSTLELNTDIIFDDYNDLIINGTIDFSNYKVSGAKTNNTFTLNSNATCKLADANGLNYALGVGGTKTLNSAANFVFNGTTAQVTGALMPTTVNNLTIDNAAGVTLTNSPQIVSGSLQINTGAIFNVSAAKQLTVTGALTNNGTLNLLSSVDGTATIITGSVNGSGTTNVNQHLTYRTWYMSSPVASAQPANMYWIKYYDEANNQWLALYDSRAASPVPYGSNSFVTGKGYSVTPNTEITNILFTGALNTGEKTIELQKDGSTTQAGFNFVGNPYPSYIDWKAVVAETKNKPSGTSIFETGTMWYRTKINPTTFKYFTVDALGNVAPANNAVTAFIPPMQGFWVKTNTDASTLFFEDNMRSHAGTGLNPSINPLKAPAATQSELSLLRLQVSNGTNTDEAVIYSYASATDGYDFYDSPKMMNNDATIPEIYTTLNNKPMVINVMNSLPLDTEIGLAFVPGDATSFSLRASEITNLPSDVKVILKDYANNGQETDLTDGAAVYNFTPATTTGDRFSIIFRSAGSTTALNTNTGNGISVYSLKKGINVTVNAELNEHATVRVFNAVGQQLINQRLTNRSTTISGNFNPGVYVVKVSNGTTVTATQKIVIK